MKNNKNINENKKRKEENNKKWIKYTVIACLAFFILLIIFFVIQKNGYSIVTIDVNPSIELKLNGDDRIVDYDAKDEVMDDLIDDMDLEGTNIVVALNAIIGSMVRNGYIDELSNSVLVSVQSKNVNKSVTLENLLVKEIDDILKASNIDGAVIGLTVSNSENLSGVAEVNGISLGKAKLITALVQVNNLLNINDLAKLTINELSLLLDTYKTSIDKIGDASSKQYIGEEEAKNIALNHANVTNPTMLNIEFDLDDGIMIYDIDFYSNNIEYDYEINATTGAIMKYNKDIENNYSNNGNNDVVVPGEDNKYISKEEAKQIAINHAGVNPTWIEVKFDYENGIAVYEIEFKYQRYEYEYEIDAISGEIYKNKKEHD